MAVSTTLLPVTATIAIALFLAKEVLEAVRRSKADKRKLRAIRLSLARECERNLWTLRSLKRALEEARESLAKKPRGSFSISRRASGRDEWRRFDEAGDIYSGGPLPRIRTEAVDSATLVVAELDRRLFEPLEVGIGAAAELNHLRGSLIDSADGSDPVEAVHFPSFVGWALEELPAIEVSLNELYVACTGHQLERPRLR